MGIFTSCCKPSASEVLTPDSETRRRQQVEAAERRAAQEAARGVKDPSKVMRIQQRNEEMEKREQELNKQGGANLRWTSGWDEAPSGSCQSGQTEPKEKNEKYKYKNWPQHGFMPHTYT